MRVMNKTILVAHRVTSLKTIEAELIASFAWEPGDGGPMYLLAVTKNHSDTSRLVTEVATGAAICRVRDSAPRAAPRFAREELAKVVARMGGPAKTRQKIDAGIAHVLAVQRQAQIDEMLKGA